MLRQCWRFWKEYIDPILSLGGYISGIAAFLGITGAAIMAWLFARLDWFWSTFQWAGILSVAIITWFIVGAGTNLYRRQRHGGDSQLDPWLMGAGLAALALVICLIGYALTAGSQPRAATLVDESAIHQLNSKIASLQKQNTELRKQVENSGSAIHREFSNYSKAQISKIVEAIDALYTPLLNIGRVLRSGVGASGSLEGNIRQRGPAETIKLLDAVRLQLNPETDKLNNIVAEYGLYKEAVSVVGDHKQFHDKFFGAFNELMGVLRQMPESLPDNLIRTVIKDKNEAFAAATKNYLEWAQQKKKELEDSREGFLRSDTTD